MSKLIKCWLCLIESGKELNTNNHMLMKSIQSDYYNYSICNDCPSHLLELYETQFNKKKNSDFSSNLHSLEICESESQEIPSLYEHCRELEKDKRLSNYRRQLHYNDNLSDIQEAMESSIKNGTRHSDEYIFSLIEKYKLDGDFSINIFMALIECTLTPYIMVNNDIDFLRAKVLSNFKSKEIDISLFEHKIDENDQLIRLVTFKYGDINHLENSEKIFENTLCNN